MTDTAAENEATAKAYLQVLGFHPCYDVPGRECQEFVLHFRAVPTYVYVGIADGRVAVYGGVASAPTMGEVGSVRLTALPGPFMRKLRSLLEEAIDDAGRESKSSG